jgi:D-alanyl-D-alanine carboxypeptidase
VSVTARHGSLWFSLALVAGACASPVIESGSAPRPTAAMPSSTVVATDVSSTTSPDPAVSTTPESVATEPPTTSGAPTTSGTPITITSVAPLTGWDAVDRYLEITLIRGGSNAASIAVMSNGELEHAEAFGERVPGDPAETGDRFRVASISKTITAITALRLVEAGTADLDAPIGSLLASDLGVGTPAAGVAALTIRQLLTHRSGFAQYEDLFFRNEVGSCRAAAVVGLTQSLQGNPGVRFQYSNMNFCLLGIAIEVLTGERYENVVRREVLDPLGIDGMRMADTFDVGVGDVEHRSEDGRNYMEVLGAAGAWIATPTDLVAILDSIDPATPGTKLLDAATLIEMQTITVDPPEPADEQDPPGSATTTTIPQDPTSGYGMGLMIFDAEDDVALSFGHTGTLESTHAMFARRPDGLTWAVTVSGDYPSSTPALAKIVDNALLLGGFTDGSYVVVPQPLSEG